MEPIVPHSGPPAPLTVEAPPAPPRLHRISGAILIFVDSLWLLAEWNALTWILTIPLSFVTVCIPVFMIQWWVQGNVFWKALAKGIICGVIAAVPTPLMGTVVGVYFLAQLGVRK